MAEMTWRKMPRSIIRDENLLYISDQLPQEYSYTPWMFYYTALSIADDDGVFDLEDGIVFSRLMKVKDPKIVFAVANLMMQRHLILRANSTSTKCILTNWEFKENDRRTMDQRRLSVSKKIEEEQKARQTQVQFSYPSEQTAAEECFTINFDRPKDHNFFCDLNDKNEKNVTKKNVVDKNRIFVDKTEREKETVETREKEFKEREKETHTEREALQAQATAFRALEENTVEQQEELQYEEQPEEAAQEINNLAELALNAGKSNVQDKSIQTYRYLLTFFAKNNLGFNEVEHYDAMMELANKLTALSDDRNPPEIIAINFTEQYKKLIENSQYYQTQPILPEYMLKPGCYAHVLGAVSKILLNKNSDPSAWYEQAQQAEQEVMAEKNLVGNVFENEYLRYNIDPKDPAAPMKLLTIKSQLQGGNTG